MEHKNVPRETHCYKMVTKCPSPEDTKEKGQPRRTDPRIDSLVVYTCLQHTLNHVDLSGCGTYTTHINVVALEEASDATY